MVLRRVLVAPLVAAMIAAMALVMGTPAHAAPETKRITVRVYHQAISPIAVLTTPAATVRTFFGPIAVDGKAADGQYITGTLTTLVGGMPGGLEVRSSNLVFVFGSEANQIVVGGISLYPPTGATLAPGQRTVRPVLGGSGTYDGARGEVVSTNLGADGWTHVFRITVD
jgi:hypothetical protein